MGCSSSSAKAQEPKPQEEAKPESEAPPPTLAEATPQERALTQLKLVFDSIDNNEDGSISKDELTKALEKDQSLGALIKDAGFNVKYNDLSGLDTNKDGSVSWEEFQGNLKEQAVEEVKDKGELAAAQVPAHEKVLKQLKAIFDGIDANEDGAVSKDELAAKLKGDTDEHGLMKDGSFGQLVEEAGFNPGFHTFEGLDTNADGRITWEEFEANLRKAAKAEVKEQGDVMAAVEPLDADDGAAPLCGCW